MQKEKTKPVRDVQGAGLRPRVPPAGDMFSSPCFLHMSLAKVVIEHPGSHIPAKLWCHIIGLADDGHGRATALLSLLHSSSFPGGTAGRLGPHPRRRRTCRLVDKGSMTTAQTQGRRASGSDDRTDFAPAAMTMDPGRVRASPTARCGGPLPPCRFPPPPPLFTQAMEHGLAARRLARAPDGNKGLKPSHKPVGAQPPRLVSWTCIGVPKPLELAASCPTK